VGSDREDPDTPDGLDVLAIGYRRHLQDPTDPESDILMEWIVQTRGPRPTPESAQFRILIDVDRDGTFDTVIYNLDAAEIGTYVRESFDPGRWLNAQAPLVEGTLEPNNFDIRAWAYQPYQLDETTTVLLANADEMGIDLRTENAVFDFAIMAVDVAGDYEPSPEFGAPRDLVPDGLLSGARLTYRQAAADCLAFESAIPIGPRATISSEVSLYCEEPALGESIGLLSSYVSNPPGAMAASSRLGSFEARMPAIYLPKSEK
jgi:hypothetical protein